MPGYISAISTLLRPLILSFNTLFMVSVSFGVHADLHSIIDSNTIKVGVINDEHHHRLTRDGHTGLDVELARGFANYLGVELVVMPFYHEDTLINALENAQVDIAAPTFSRPGNDAEVVPGPVFFSSPLMVIHRRDSQPNCSNAPPAKRLITKALIPLATAATHLEWHSSDQVNTVTLLNAVTNQESECTLLPKAFFERLSEFHSNLTATELSAYFKINDGSAPVAITKQWLMSPSDTALRSSVFEYIHFTRQNQQLAILSDVVNATVPLITEINADKFVMDVENKLPQLRSVFEQAANVLPWPMIAAIDYLESEWQTSPANSDRAVLNQSSKRMRAINQRLEMLNVQLPARITGTDRDWLLIAAYHCGLAHIEDARELARHSGANPDLWINIKPQLAKLTLPAHYRQSRHGYVNGKQALKFVDRVRFFADSLSVVVDEVKSAQAN